MLSHNIKFIQTKLNNKLSKIKLLRLKIEKMRQMKYRVNQ